MEFEKVSTRITNRINIFEKKIDLEYLYTILVFFSIFAFNFNNNLFINGSIITNVLIFTFILKEFFIAIKNNRFYLYDSFKYYFLFILICFISIFYSYNSMDSFNKTATLFELALFGICIFQYLKRGHLIDAFKAYSWAWFFCSIYLILNYDFSAQRIGSLIGDANLIGISYSFAILIACYLASISKKKIFYIIEILLFSFMCLLTGSRAGLITSIISIIFFIYSKAIISHISMRKIIMITFLIVIIIGILCYVIFNNDFLYEIIGIRIISFFEIIKFGESSTREYSTTLRLEFMTRALDWWKMSPIVGNGIGAFPSYNESFSNGWYCFSHCDYTEMLCSVGIIGTVIFYLPIFIDLLRFLKKSNKSSLNALQISLMIAFLISEIFLVMYYEKSTWILLAFLVGISSIDAKRGVNDGQEKGNS